jgi:murein DD-endopeptidase MepM/ murein hydrolase activator NlpD
VKKLAIALFLVVGFVILGSATGLTPTVERLAGQVANKLVLYVHVARLYTKEPDRTLAMPVHNVTKDQVANTWHAPRGSDRLHQGQDIFAPRGTPILSATDGYIMRIGENSLGGQTVSVVGAGGRIYYYAHLDSYGPQIAEGDFVTTRSVLGYVGTTGNAVGTPPHLHFGVYSAGGAINPLPLLADRPQENRSRLEPATDKRRSARIRKTN